MLRKMLAEDPEQPVAYLELGDTLMRAGRVEEAVQCVEKAVAMAGRPTPWLGMLGSFRGISGDVAPARAILEELEARAVSGYVSGFWSALVHAGLGALDEAFACLGRAVEERDSSIVYLSAVPRALGLHEDPRFPDLLERVGLGHLAPNS